MIYAIPIMWDLLDEADQQILTHFVMACFLLTVRIIEDSALDEAYSRLLMVAHLVKDNYGLEMIIPNFHLSFHLTECCQDYGPLYTFWYYSFERMDSIVGK